MFGTACTTNNDCVRRLDSQKTDSQSPARQQYSRRRAILQSLMLLPWSLSSRAQTSGHAQSTRTCINSEAAAAPKLESLLVYPPEV